ERDVKGARLCKRSRVRPALSEVFGLSTCGSLKSHDSTRPADWISLAFLEIRCENPVAGVPNFVAVKGWKIAGQGGISPSAHRIIGLGLLPVTARESQFLRSSSVHNRSEWMDIYAGPGVRTGVDWGSAIASQQQ
ncbi:17048_t:CDS:1, partial [Acaulospora colombiana]